MNSNYNKSVKLNADFVVPNLITTICQTPQKELDPASKGSTFEYLALHKISKALIDK